jgi:hypothetical protein
MQRKRESESDAEGDVSVSCAVTSVSQCDALVTAGHGSLEDDLPRGAGHLPGLQVAQILQGADFINLFRPKIFLKFYLSV